MSDDSLYSVRTVGASHSLGLDSVGLTFCRHLGCHRTNIKTLARLKSFLVHRGMRKSLRHAMIGGLPLVEDVLMTVHATGGASILGKDRRIALLETIHACRWQAGITQVKVGLGSVLGNDQRLLREILLAGEFPPKTQADQNRQTQDHPPTQTCPAIGAGRSLRLFGWIATEALPCGKKSSRWSEMINQGFQALISPNKGAKFYLTSVREPEILF